MPLHLYQHKNQGTMANNREPETTTYNGIRGLNPVETR
jgi:hypothetical protein